MKTRSIMLMAGALLCAANPAAAQPGTGAVAAASVEHPELQGLDAFISKALQEWNAPGATISIVKDGEVILSKGYGARDLATGAPMNSETIFPIQSETKAFTGLTAAMLRDEGKLNLDAPISTYIPGFRMHDSVATLEVSIRDFLTHRSGLGIYSWLWIANNQLNREEAMDRIAHLPQVAPIRTEWRYANMGYVAAARAMELVSGTPWESFVEERIFRPLGMTRTTFSRSEAEADPNHIGGSMIRHGNRVRTPMQGTTALTNSTGGIFSTADDMAKWMLFQLNEGKAAGQQLVKQESIAETHKPQMITGRPLPPPQFTSSAYGLGWFVESYRGERLIEHGGNHWGVGSALGLLPDREVGVSVFANQDGDLAAFLMLSILDRFIGGDGRDWVGNMLANHKAYEAERSAAAGKRDQQRVLETTPTHPLSAYAGSYVHPGYGTITIGFAEGRLEARFGDDTSPLKHWHHDVFVPTATEFGNIWAMYEGMQVQFLSDFSGKVVGLRTSATPEGTLFKKED